MNINQAAVIYAGQGTVTGHHKPTIPPEITVAETPRIITTH
jgi:hypothetical protein